MKQIDEEIRLIEQRMARRRHEIGDVARAAKNRAKRKLLSPAGLATAAGLGFLATVGFLRKKQAPTYVSADKVKGGAAVGAIGMLMPIALAIVKAQFGSPAGLAQFLLAKMKKPPSPRGDGNAARAARPMPVHPAR